MDEQYSQSFNTSTMQRIKGYLRKKEAQERIQKRMQEARSKITVTISRAAELFGVSENQLRDWEKRGLLKTERNAKQDGKATTGHRQYTQQELDKLAVIKELLDNGDFTLGDIPPMVDDLYFDLAQSGLQATQVAPPSQVGQVGREKIDDTAINVRIVEARRELFWRFYTSRALRLALMLICDELPGTTVGLILPLRSDTSVPTAYNTRNLPEVGPSLVGWLSRGRSSHTLYTDVPSFQYATDYDLLPLTVMKDDRWSEVPMDKTLIVLDRWDRRAKGLTLTPFVVETIRRLLAPIYTNAQNMRAYFGPGMRDELDPATNLEETNSADSILDGLTDMVVRLGGRLESHDDRWRFCCILIPKDPLLPLQQRTLVVRAQSQHSPHRVGGTTVTPDKSINSLSLRAYQSGHVIYRTNITSTDTSIAHYRVEGPIRSAIAFPIGGENGPVIGVLYAVSDEPDAFSEQSQRVLRMICRMAEEAICTYRTRRQTATRLTNAIDRPRSVDALFEEFLSENDFIRDFEKLLTELKAQLPVWKEPILKEKAPLEERKTQARAEQHSGNVVSFIAIDIDNQSSLATKYGDQVARNLSKEVGLRIQGQIRLFADPEHRRLYRVYADRFYLMLKGMTLDEARAKAEQLRQDLQGSYRVNARNIPAEHLRLPERMLELSDITVRLGVSSYSYEKLKELLQRYSFETAREDIRVEIMRALDILLNYGQQKEGNVIFSWDIDTWDYKPWAPNT